MKLPDFEAWAMFACVVEHRSFSAAAQALGVSKATVSKAISRLEASLATPLFHRTSRRLTLTEGGRALAERAQRILSEAQCAEEAARETATRPAGLVRLAAPMTFGLRHIAPAIADFLTEQPEIEVDLRLSDARVDIVAEGIDVAVRIADLPDSSLRARRLRGVTSHCVASPKYLERRGTPRHPAELGEHDCFGYTNVPRQVWKFRSPEGEEVSVRPEGRLRSDSGEAMLPALCAGLGVCALPDFIVGEDLAAGRLVSLLPGWSLPPIGMHLLTPPGEIRPARVEALIAFLVGRLREA
jgi:DNA-binding transcriptional LysR family regulator